MAEGIWELPAELVAVSGGVPEPPPVQRKPSSVNLKKVSDYA
jgi:hypothetical protein